ncbi:MAG: NUDIX hydrolase [Pseudomonadota bacterium]
MRRVKFKTHEQLAKVGSFIRLDRYDVEYPTYNVAEYGDYKQGTLVNVHRGDAVAGLLHVKRGENDFLLLVEQFRMPTIINATSGMPDMDLVDKEESAGRMIELMAGTQEAGEPWMETFRRECFEETKFQPEEIEFISSYYPSPGACSEQIHLYYGRVSVPDGTPLLDEEHEDTESYGDESEDIRRIFMTPTEFLDAIRTGRIVDGKALAAAEWMRRPGSEDIMGIKLNQGE